MATINLNPGDYWQGNMIYSSRHGSYLTPEQYAQWNVDLANRNMLQGGPRNAPDAHSNVDATNLNLMAALSGSGPTPKTASTPTQVATGTTDAAGTIAVLMPDRTTRTFSLSDPALHQAIVAGGRPVNPADGGINTDIREFQGGILVGTPGGYVPLNVFAGGDWLPGQREALAAEGIPEGQPGDTETAGGAGGAGGGTGTGGTGGGTTGGGGTTYQDNGWMGNQGATAPSLNSDLEKALRELMQEARNQGVRGQEALTGLVDDYKNYLGFARSAAEQTFNRRNELTDTLLGKVTPAIESAIGTMNESTGLSPEAMAALRGQAIEGTQRDYQGQVQELKSQLGARGAYGGGSNPGDFNAILQGYAPLMQGRDATRSSLLANTILADEQRKFDTLGLNRQTAMSALGTGAGLTSALAGAYNPASMFSANEGALSGLLDTVNAGTGAGFQGLNTAGNLANVLQEMQPGSFRNTLLAALLSTGLSGSGPNGSGTPNIIKLGGWIWDQVKGGWSRDPASTAGTPRPPTTTPPYNPNEQYPG